MVLQKTFVFIFAFLIFISFSSKALLAEMGSKAGNRKPSNSTTYAAIAYSKKTGSYGYSTKEKNKLSALRAAKRECRKHANDCKTAAWTKQQCVSLTVDTGSGWGANYGTSRNHARSATLRKCSSYRVNQNCKTLATICQ